VTDERIARARDLHQPVADRTGWRPDGTYDDINPACSSCGSADDAVPYPCPTIRALDGEQP